MAVVLFTDVKDIIDGVPFSLVFVVYTGTFLDHGNGTQPKVFDSNELRRTGEPRAKQDVVCMVPAD